MYGHVPTVFFIISDIAFPYFETDEHRENTRVLFDRPEMCLSLP
jgi:hypothetical protein